MASVKTFIKKHASIIYCFSIFLVLVNLSNQIDFMQNDDWVHYKNTEMFMNGNIVLDQYLGPTFYTQGIMGALFGKLFSLDKIPILTLLLAVSALYIFIHILRKFFNKSLIESFLLGSLLFFSPLNLYSLWGYMTESYYMFFLILAFYLFLKYERGKNKNFLLILYIILWIALFLRQIILVFPMGLCIFYLLKKKYKLAGLNFLMFVSMYLYYSFLFPQTDAMTGKSFAFNHLMELDYTYGLIYGTLVLLVAFLLPLFLSSINIKELFKNKIKSLFFVFVGILLFIFLNKLFNPSVISWGEFPYFENTYERMGFYPRGVQGTKYQFIGNYDLYRYWDLSSKILLSVFISYWIFYIRKIKDFFLIFSIVYLGILICTDTFYDRYMLFLIPPVILYLGSFLKLGKIGKIYTSCFLAFLIFYGYQFSMDFVLSNKYIWGKSNELVENLGVDPKQIHGSNSWKLKYRNEGRAYLFNFSYDSQEVNEGFACCYKLLETYRVRYPFNFFINPNIYLYEMVSDPSLILQQ